MIHRIFALIATATLSVAPSPPPPVLTPYIHEGRFEPGDYGWMRGAFAGATDRQRSEWLALMTWRKQCIDAESLGVRAAMAQRGITVSASMHNPGNALCGDVGYAMPRESQGEDWSAFQAAVARARPVAPAIIWGSALAQSIADPDAPDDASSLIARPMTDQVLRSSLSWDKGEIAGAPALDPAALGIAQGLIWLAIAGRDHANTAWMKNKAAMTGWPTIGKVGETASHAAWLLVQHADDDPVFQFDMLRLMEPLATKGDVTKKDYAFLYDRVMLKMVGKQRYGSQVGCTDGRHVPLPLENAAGVDDLRKAFGMGTVAENIARIDKSYGPCPAERIGTPAPTK